MTDKSINPSQRQENGIIPLFGVASGADLYQPTSFVATNQYYQASIEGDTGVNPQGSLETN